MRVLIAGDWHSDIHEESVKYAFEKIGWDVSSFKWYTYFSLNKNIFSKIFTKIQSRFLLGPLVSKLNKDLISQVRDVKPDMVFIYRGAYIPAKTISAIKESNPDIVVVGYNNDDPCSDKYPFWEWRHFLKSLPFYDVVCAYRHHNLDDFAKYGAKKTYLLRSWFHPEKNKEISLTDSDKEKYQTDVVFVGHHEEDHRTDYLKAIMDEGIDLKLWGPGYHWDQVLNQDQTLKKLVPVELVWKDDYNKALCGSKIALCFLSTLNRDTYTRRCFEIPAAKTLMLAQYSDDLASLYEEDKEVVFFRTKEEMLDKIKYYLADDTLRNKISVAGYNRAVSSGYDVVSRIRELMDFIREKGK